MLQCNCPLIKMTKGYSEVLMNPSQLHLKEQIADLVTLRLPIEKEIALYLINKEFQRWQMKNKMYLCSIGLMPFRKKKDIVYECLFHLKQEVYSVISDISESNDNFDGKIEDIVENCINWLKETPITCPRMQEIVE
ncbi:MAG: hypothetical protein ACFE95_12200 [Candidatus Hodarchaeota archaeon]